MACSRSERFAKTVHITIAGGGGFMVEYAYNIMDRVTNITYKTKSGEVNGTAGRIVSCNCAVGGQAWRKAYDALAV